MEKICKREKHEGDQCDNETEGSKQERKEKRTIAKNGEYLIERTRDLLVRSHTREQRSQETAHSNGDEKETGAERDIPVVRDLSKDDLGYAERTVRKSVNETDHETQVVVRAQPKSGDAHNVAYARTRNAALTYQNYDHCLLSTPSIRIPAPENASWNLSQVVHRKQEPGEVANI